MSTVSGWNHRLLFSLWFAMLIAAGAAQSAELKLLVLGDSLSDQGILYARTGLPPSPPYFAGRFSNGPLWVDQFIADLGLTTDQVMNYAVGGATSGRLNITHPAGQGVLDQLDLLVASPPAIGPGTLVVVWAGANDLFAAFADPTQAAAVITAAANNTATVLGTLIALGARDIWVPNIPNVARTPEVIALSAVDPTAPAGAEALTRALNGAIDQAIAAVEGAAGVSIHRLDTFGLFESIAAGPGTYGLASITERCLAADLSGPCAHPEASLFWDGVHPTTAGHRIIEDFFVDQIFPRFLRGDCNGNGRFEVIPDAVAVLRFLFLGRRPAPCLAACDSNASGTVGIEDALLILHRGFLGGPSPIPPFPSCGAGLGPQDRTLGCQAEPSACK